MNRWRATSIPWLCAALLLGCGALREADHPPVRLTVLQFNDHYILEPVDRERGGMARIATLVARVRAESPHTLLALAGDTLSPSLMSSLLQGEQMIAAWNLLGLDVATFGNHEFDFGPAVLRERMRQSRFSWLSANVLERATGRPFGGAHPHLVLERGGVRVGLFGLTTPETTEASQPGPDVEFRAPVAAARAAVASLSAGGRPLLVAVTHQPMAADEALARALPEVALVIGGHEHDPLERVVGDTLITKAGADGVFVVRIDLQATRDGRVLDRRHRFVPVTAEIPEEPRMAGLVAAYAARLDRALERQVGETRVPLEARASALRTGEANAGSLVADVLRARVGADVGLMNGGGIRTNQVVPAGPLTVRDVRALLPFPNVIVKLELSGAALLEVLERAVSRYPEPAGAFLQVSGLAFAFDPARPPGQRVVRVTVGAAPLDPGRRYTVATNDYLARGGDGYATLAGARVLLGPEDGPGLTEAVVEAIERAGVVEPRVEGRIRPAD